MDAEKAFDKLVHDKGFCKLYHYNIIDDNSILIRQLQRQAITKVKWKEKSSKGFTTMQDIRQRVKLSPTFYKAYNNQLLNVLRDKKIGAMIGTTFIGCPSVADDIALITDDPQDLQHALVQIRVITKLPNSEQSSKGKDKTHKYINRQISQQLENCKNRNDTDLVQAFLKKWWVESDFKASTPSPFHYGSKVPAVTITVFITILEQNR